MKNIYKDKTKKEARKAQAHISLLSQIEQWKKSQDGVDAGGKNWICIFKAKERKQYQSKGKMVLKNLFIAIIYFIEAFKMRLLSIADSFDLAKRSNSTFNWLGRFLKDELMLDMSMK